MIVPSSVWTAAWRLAEEDTDFDPNIVTPGVEGFLFTALFAAMVIGLGIVLVRRLRRNQYRADAREQIALELAERDAAEGTTAEGDAAADGSAAADPAPEK